MRRVDLDLAVRRVRDVRLALAGLLVLSMTANLALTVGFAGRETATVLVPATAGPSWAVGGSGPGEGRAGAVLASAGDLDHRPARVPDRDAAERPRALAVPARTGLAAGDPRRRRLAFDASAPGAPVGIPPSLGCVFRLAVAPLLLGDGAGRAVGPAAESGRLALDADPGFPPGTL